MPLDAAIAQIEPLSDAKYVADNDDRASATRDITDRHVYHAAQHIIDRYRAGAIIKIEAFDVPHEALADIAAQLEALGVEQAMTDELVRALKEYVTSKGGSFARAANAKPILIALEVTDKKPEFRFSEGVTEMAAIDGVSAKVEGIGNVEVQYTNSGTVMTSNRANVDKIFSAVQGIKLWIRFEAPTKSEMDGVLNDMQQMMAMLGEAVGGAVSAAELKDLLVKIEADGTMPPAVMELVANLVEMRSLIEAGVTPQTKAQVEKLVEAVTQQLSQMAELQIPVALAQGAAQSIERMVETYDIAHIIPPEAVQALNTQVAVQTVALQLAVLADILEGAPRAELEALIETLKGAELADIIPQMEAIAAHIEQTGLAEMAAEHVPDLARGMDEARALVEPQVAQTLKTPELKAAEEIIALIETLEGADALPPELQAVIEKIDIAALDAESIAEVLKADPGQPPADPALAELIRDVVVTLNKPEIQAALPQETLNSVNIFITDNKAAVEAVVIQAVIAELQTALVSGTLEKTDIETVQTVIEQLQAGKPVQTLDVTQLEIIAATAQGPALPAIAQAVQTIAEAKAPPVLLANDTLAIVQAMTADLGTLKDALQANPDITPEQIVLVQSLESVIEALKTDPADMKAVQAIAALGALVQEGALPALPEAALPVLEKITPVIEQIAQMQQVAQAIQHRVAPQVIADAASVMTTLKSAPPELITALVERGIDIQKTLETLQANPVSLEAAAQIAALQAAAPDIMPPATAAKLESIAAAQISKLAADTGLPPATISETVTLVTSLKNAPPELKQALADKGASVAEIVHALEKDAGSLNAVQEMIKLQAIAPELLPPQTAAKIESIIAAQVTRIAADTGMPPVAVKNVIETIAVLKNPPAELKQALASAKIDTAAIIQSLEADMGSVKAVQQIMQLQTAARESLPPATAIKIESIVAAQIDAIAANTGMPPAAVKNVIETIATLNNAAPDIKKIFSDQKIDTAAVIKSLETNMGSVKAVQEMIKLQAVAPGLLPPQAAAKIEAIVAAQVTRIAADTGMPPAAVRNVIETIAAISAAPPQLKQELARAHIDVDQVVRALEKDLSSPQAARDAIALNLELQRLSPALAAPLAQKVEAMVTAQVGAIAREQGIPPAAARNALEIAAVLKTAPQVASKLEAAGINIQKIEAALLKNPGAADTLYEIARLQAIAPTLPPETAAPIMQRVETVMKAHADVMAIKQNIPAALALDTVKATAALEVLPPAEKRALAAARIDVDAIVRQIRDNPAGPQALPLLAELKSKIETGTLPPKAEAPLREALQAMAERQAVELTRKQPVTIETARTVIEAAVALQSLPDAARPALRAVQIEPADIIRSLKEGAAPERALPQIAALQAVIENNPAQANVLKPAIDALVRVQADRIIRETGLPRPLAESTVLSIATLKTMPPETHRALAQHGIDVKQIERIAAAPGPAAREILPLIVEARAALRAQPPRAQDRPAIEQFTRHIETAAKTMGVSAPALAVTAEIAGKMKALSRTDVQQLQKAGVDTKTIERAFSRDASPADIKRAVEQIQKAPPAAQKILLEKTGINAGPATQRIDMPTNDNGRIILREKFIRPAEGWPPVSTSPAFTGNPIKADVKPENPADPSPRSTHPATGPKPAGGPPLMPPSQPSPVLTPTLKTSDEKAPPSQRSPVREADNRNDRPPQPEPPPSTIEPVYREDPALKAGKLDEVEFEKIAEKKIKTKCEEDCDGTCCDIFADATKMAEADKNMAAFAASINIDNLDEVDKLQKIQAPAPMPIAA